MTWTEYLAEVEARHAEHREFDDDMPTLIARVRELEGALADVRSELSSAPIDRDWCIDRICAVLANQVP